MAKRQRRVQTRLQDKMLRGAVEGGQEELYFEHLEKLINNHPARRKNLRINFSVSRGGSPLKVAQKAVEIKTTGAIDRAAVFDHDRKPDEFAQALDLCKRHTVIHAYSNLCFDLWLILHKTPYHKPVHQPKDYAKNLIELYSLPEDADIKNASTVSSMLEQISLQEVREAIDRAEEIVRQQETAGIPRHTPKSVRYYDNPDLSIHRLVQQILEHAGL